MIFFLAWRQIRWRKKQTAVSVISIAIGVTMAITISSTQLGFEEDFIQRLVAVSPHVKLTAERERPVPAFDGRRHDLAQVLRIKSFDNRKTINGSAHWRQQIEGLEGVQAVSMVYQNQGLVTFTNKDLAVVIRGIEPQQENIISGFSENLQRKRGTELITTKNAIILGSGVARKLGAGVDDKITVVNDEGNRDIFKIIDIYQSGLAAFDDQTVFTERKTAEAFFAVHGPNEFSIRLTDPNKAEVYRRTVSQMTGLVTNDWLSENETLRSNLVQRRWINLSIIGTMFLVAAFGIANILLMSTLSKRRDIAIMQAFGVTKGMLTKLFIAQGCILGVLGGVLGGLSGALLNWIVALLPVSFNAAITRQGFPVVWESSIFLLAMGGGVLISILASVFPARKAASFQPAEVIRRG